MAYIMIIGANPFATEAMKGALEQRGHFVRTASNFDQVREACGSLTFDLVAVGEEIAPNVKRALGLQLKEYCSRSPVLEICSSQPCLADADYVIKSTSYAELAQKIEDILLSGAKRKMG